VEAWRFPFRAMGSPCVLELYARTRDAATRVAAECTAEVARLERKYTRFRDDSLTTRINRASGDPEGVVVDDETASLLDYADTGHAQSDGLFDITSGVLREVWDFRSGRVPADARVRDVLERVGWRRVRWERPRVVLPIAGMQLDFGGFVKEYAADRAAERARRLGCGHGLVDLGGDLSVIGPHPDGSPWRVGLRDPRDPERAIARIDLWQGGVATSGDYERFMIVDGVRYAHILDPRSGWPVEGLASVSVLASHCLIAGTTSTIGMLRGPDGGDWLDATGLPHVRVSPEGKAVDRLRPR
jgi:thiamine biosynthesis lipoprotein